MGAVIRIDILGDSKSAQRSASDANRAYSKLGSGADKTSSKVGRLGRTFGTAARSFAGAVGLTLGAAAVVRLGTDSIRAASDVQQAFGAIDAVFDKNAAQVKKWASSAANDVGLAKSEYANLAVVAGSMLKNTGIEDYAAKTRQLIKLGSDLAATYGGTTKDAMESISALLRGETDPIEKYGVSIKQSAINAELASKGLDKLTGSALVQAQQQARLKLLYDQTTAAQGQFGRESDTLANAQQKLGAKWENLKATLGEKLLPVATKFISFLSDAFDGSTTAGAAFQKVGQIIGGFLTPIIDAGREAWSSINTAVNKATGSNHGMQLVLSKVASIAAKLAPILGKTLATKIKFMGDAITIAVGVAGKLWKAFQKVRDWANKVIGPIEKVASALDKINPAKLAGKGLGAVAGLFRSEGGLGRAGGGLVFGGAGISPTFNLGLSMSPTITVEIGGRSFDAAIRTIVRNEIAHQIVSAKRGDR